MYLHFGGGGVGANSASGGAVVVGATGRIGPVLVDVNPIETTLSPGDTYPYYRDYFDNGGSACRNSINGQFADDVNCIAIDAHNAFSAGAALVLPGTPVFAGGGSRYDEDAWIWFGSAGAVWQMSRRWVVLGRVNIGQDYVLGTVSLGWKALR